MKDLFDEKMHVSRPEQSIPAREAMFVRVMEQVSGGMPVSTKIVSPYTMWLQKPARSLVAGLFGVFLVVGLGGTVAAAEAAKPGDWLFSVDQKTEAMRLLLASEARKVELRSAFLDERQQELTAIIAEEVERTKREIEEISDSLKVNEQGEERIARAVDAFLRQAEQLPQSDTESRRRAVISLIDEVRVHGREGDDMRLRIDDDRFEIRTETMRVRSRDDGELEVRIGHDDNHRDDNDSDNDRSIHKDDDNKFDDSNPRDKESDDLNDDDHEEEDKRDTSGHGSVNDMRDRRDDDDERSKDREGDDDKNEDEDKGEDKKGRQFR
ncbi:MAG: hypothetical protein ACK4SL_03760 [Candidatus Paceibacteria bacterium]